MRPCRHHAARSTQHAPSRFRTNQVVCNFPEFYSAFGTAAGDRMFLLASGSNCRRAIRRPRDMKEPDTHTITLST
ncbi:hypothetical protein IU450_01240 [Nocardia abscessus]|uniref:M13-type metalloendopeptidase n=1 Tax=Nocardia abscessus TaxID=120957 RepID=UPI001896293C|nr:hypothetical protein [Nocardia abscessus]